MRVYFVRHGSSVANEGNIHQTDHDELSPTGLRQAGIVARRLEGHSIERVIASPLARARETGRVVAEHLGVPIEFDADLVEKRNPPEIVGLNFDHPQALAVREAMSANVHDPNWRYSTEENYHDVVRRARAFRARLGRLNQQHLAVVSHGYYLKMLFCTLMLGDALTFPVADAFDRFCNLTNTGVTVCDRSDRGTWQLITLNDRLHVP